MAPKQLKEIKDDDPRDFGNTYVGGGGGWRVPGVVAPGVVSPGDVGGGNHEDDFTGGGVPGGSKFDTQKYLIQSGLQNIFDLYNKQISNLDKSQQQDIENAYFLREMSRKYLGEYASNVGVGDVSGDLLNIYGMYQQNLNQINQYYNELSLGITEKYQQNKQQLEFGLAEIEQGIKDEERANQIYEIKHNLLTGQLPEGMTTSQYLDSVREILGEEAYWSLKTQYTLEGMQGEEWNEDMFEFKEVDEDMSTWNADIEEGAKIFKNESTNTYLATTGNIIYDENMIKELLKAWENEGGSMNRGFNRPFGYGEYYFLRNLDGDFELLKQISQKEDYVEGSKYEKDSEGYKSLEELLGNKTGSLTSETGLKAFIYDKENDEYIQYLDFIASKGKGQVINFNIGDSEWEFNPSKYSQAESVSLYNSNLWDGTDFTESHKKNAIRTPNGIEKMEITKKIIETYFGGDTKAFSDYVKQDNEYVDYRNKLVFEHNDEFYTIHKNGLYKLKKK